MKLYKTAVISAYPCCGKSYVTEHGFCGYKILDSDSRNFSWIFREYTDEEIKEFTDRYEEGKHLLSVKGFKELMRGQKIPKRNPNFVEDYMKHVEDNIGKADIIFVSSHLEVRKALQELTNKRDDFEFYTVYPEPEMLEEFVGRMYLRHNTNQFIDKQISMWKTNMKNIENEPHGKLYRLDHEEYMTDILERYF